MKDRWLVDAGVRERYQALFAGHGIAADRLIFTGSAPRRDFIAAYGGIDVSLDPFPYTGGVTTLESLWMGVPVITLNGDRFAGHTAATLLNAVGLNEFVAGSVADYIRIAQSVESERLAGLRAGLRSRLVASPVCDGPAFARKLESAFRTMWREYCRAGG